MKAFVFTIMNDSEFMKILYPEHKSTEKNQQTIKIYSAEEVHAS